MTYCIQNKHAKMLKGGFETSQLYYSPIVSAKEFKVGRVPVPVERNSFSTQPKNNQGKLTRKGLYGEVNPNILKLLAEGK